jgi:hypothetical protein
LIFVLLAWVTGSLGEAVAVRGSRASIHVLGPSPDLTRTRVNAGVIDGVDHTVNQSGATKQEFIHEWTRINTNKIKELIAFTLFVLIRVHSWIES